MQLERVSISHLCVNFKVLIYKVPMRRIIGMKRNGDVCVRHGNTRAMAKRKSGENNHSDEFHMHRKAFRHTVEWFMANIDPAVHTWVIIVWFYGVTMYVEYVNI